MKAGAHPWTLVPLRKPGLGRERRCKVAPALSLLHDQRHGFRSGLYGEKLCFMLTAVSGDGKCSEAPESAVTCRTLIRAGYGWPFRL